MDTWEERLLLSMSSADGDKGSSDPDIKAADWPKIRKRNN
jgi:hypothetical protein